MPAPDRETVTNWAGKTVVDRDGADLGSCLDTYLDEATGVPEWVNVDRTGLGPTFIPLVGADEEGGRIRVAFPASLVDAAPAYGAPRRLNDDEEVELYQHYGVPHSKERSSSVLPAPGAEEAVERAQSDTPLPKTPVVPRVETPTPTPVATAPEPKLTKTEPKPVAAPPVVETTPPPAVVETRELTAVPAAAQKPSGNSWPMTVGAVAAGALAFYAARAQRRRVAERNKPSAKLQRGLLAASATLASQAAAGREALTAAADQAARSGRQAAQETSKRTSKAVAVTQKRTGTALDEAQKRSRKAAKQARAARKDALGAASAAGAGVADRASSVTSKTSKAASKTSAKASKAATKAPKNAAKKGRKARRTWHRNVTQFLGLAAGGTGYVLGARAGEERYEQITEAAAKVSGRPELSGVRSGGVDLDKSTTPYGGR